MPLGPEGTIYKEEKGFDSALRIDIDPVKIGFIAELKISEASSIFHVNYDGNPRVLKVVCTEAFTILIVIVHPSRTKFPCTSFLLTAFIYIVWQQ